MCDRPEFYSNEIVKARKQHKCCECDDVIAVGDRYSSASGKWEGEVCTYKTCLSCHQTWEYLANNFDIDCQYHGGLSEAVQDLELLEEEDGAYCAIGTLVPWLRRGRSGRWELVEVGGGE